MRAKLFAADLVPQLKLRMVNASDAVQSYVSTLINAKPAQTWRLKRQVCMCFMCIRGCSGLLVIIHAMHMFVRLPMSVAKLEAQAIKHMM